MARRKSARVMDADAVATALRRIAHEILESNTGRQDLAIVGIPAGRSGNVPGKPQTLYGRRSTVAAPGIPIMKNWAGRIVAAISGAPNSTNQLPAPRSVLARTAVVMSPGM